MKNDSYCLSYVSICFNLRNNFLNLLSGVIQSGRRVATYTYASDEMKLSVVGADGRGYEYYGSLIYQINGSSLTFESAGFNEGRIYSGGAYYHVKDHLGSIRLVMDQTGSVKEQNDYYPFGMRQERSNYALFAGNRFKYNGKEEQTTGGLGYLDYGARMYDAESGRWFGVDPLSEKYYGISPYAYCGNNPIRYIDPDGRIAVDFDTDLYNIAGKKIGTDGVDNGVKIVVTDKIEARQILKIKGNVDLNNVKSGVTLPSDVTLKESLNVLDRTIANGGLMEESSIVMKDGTVIQGQTGSMPTVVNGVQTATTSLPNLPAGTTPADAEATIHSHPTTVQQVGNQIFPQSASIPSATDRGTFSQYNTNIIVGPLGTVKTATINPDGTLNFPNRPNGAVIYNRNTTLQVELTRKAIQNILKK